MIAGAAATVRLAPEPPKTMLLFGTRAGLEDDLERLKLAVGVSTSPITKGIVAVAVFAGMT